MLARNIFPLFPHTPVTPEEITEKETQSVSSTTTTCARALMEVMDYYKAVFGTPTCPPVVKRELEAYYRAGMNAQVMIEALDEASVAPRPSWAYARAIIRRCISEGVLDIDAYYERQINWQYKH